MKKRNYDVPNYDGSYLEIGTDVLKNKLDLSDVYEIQVQESIGFARSYKYFSDKLSKRTRFTAKYICDIHKKALGHIYYFAGRYRSVDLSKSGHNFFPHPYIPTAMQYLEREYLLKLPTNYQTKSKLIEDIAITHIELIHIHPFREGNRRTSRILANLMCQRVGYNTINLENFRRNYYEKYIEALNSGDDKDYLPMIKIIEELI